MAGLKISINTVALKEALAVEIRSLRAATRPAAQAGAQIIYDRARQLAPVSKKKHYFYGQNERYGPFLSGNLREAIYQAFSQDNSFADTSVYHVSWNATKAPYGGMVEYGTSRAPARSFIARAVAETRSEVRNAMRRTFIEAARRAL